MRLAIGVFCAWAAMAAASGAQAEIAVKLGVLNDRSGPYADSGGEGSVVAARLAVEEFDAAGKGIKVEIVSADHQNKPDIGSSIVRRWYDQEGVDVVLDVPISSVAFAVSPLTREKNKILIASGSGASEMTGVQCSPNTLQFSYDTWSVANTTAKAVVERGGKSWFFLTSDLAFGHALERDAAAAVKRAGGTVLGAVRAPFGTTDFSSFLLQAQSAKATVIGLANGTAEVRDSVKQAREFGIPQSGIKLASLLIIINDIKGLGLEAGQGLLLTESFYWDLNDRTRAFSKRFAARHGGRMPTMLQVGVYSGVLHYLKAVAATGTKETGEVLKAMKSIKTDDDVFGPGYVREDGRKIHDMHLFEVKKPSESQGEWDLYKLVSTVPGDQAFRPLAEGGCPFVTTR
ncbi:MAG: transporter permease [Enterovirga sp.]|jgi:branched-chain amino acid transport system substrate-binding protein|nr:transporter permease [Enterovirga sp.]